LEDIVVAADGILERNAGYEDAQIDTLARQIRAAAEAMSQE